MACMGTDICTWCLREKVSRNDNDNSHLSAPCFVADRVASVCMLRNATSIPLPYSTSQHNTSKPSILPNVFVVFIALSHAFVGFVYDPLEPPCARHTRRESHLTPLL